MLSPFDDLPALLTFAAFILITELLDTDLPSGRRLSLSLAPALGFAMLQGARLGPKAGLVAAAVFVAASGSAMVGRKLARRDVRLREIVGSALTVGAAGSAYGLLRLVGPGRELVASSSTSVPYQASVAGLVAVLIITLVSEPLRALASPEPGQTRTASTAWRALASNAPLQIAMVSVAALVALAFPKLNWWSFPLFLGPLAATRYAFRQIATIRTTEVQTLRALSKIPEMAGYTQEGHSRRVALLSVAIALDLGVSDEDRRDIEYAALLHDIGRVVLEDPSAERAAHSLRNDIANAGADIVAAAETFPNVAAMIRDQHTDHRTKSGAVNEILLGSRILRVANTYDDMMGEAHATREAADLIDQMRSRTASEFDPDVVASLVRVRDRLIADAHARGLEHAV